LESYLNKVKDSPFAYRERTQVGFFAAACWRLDVPALEEWRTMKGTIEDPIKGRCDLWIDTNDFHIEAKHAWSNVVHSDARIIQGVSTTLDLAEVSAKVLTCDACSKLAFSFVTACIPKEEFERCEVLTERWLQIVSNIPCDALAWYMPKIQRPQPFDFPHLAVGTALLVKRV
jgi:hypothetical protein